MAITKLNSRSLSSGAVTTDLLASNAVTTAKIGVDVIVAEDIAANAITVSELAANAVTTVKIADGAITAAKIASGAIPSGVDIQSSAPSVASEGSLYYNTTSNLLYASNGTAWQVVGNIPPAATGGTVTIPPQLGLSTFTYNLGLNFTDADTPDANLAYTLASGTLPAGAVLPTTGNSALTGTATNTTATYNFVIKATDGQGASSTQAYTQVITAFVATTGGTITTSGGYRYHTFTSSGTLTFGNKTESAQAIVLAGGGGAGKDHHGAAPNGRGAGGGGAGGFIYEAFTLSSNKTIAVGAGGTNTGANGVPGTQGGNTTVTGLTTAIGGGGGGSHHGTAISGYVYSNAGSGGSGGGGPQIEPGGAGTAGQGNAGGQGSGASIYGGAGGGGKGGVGAAGRNVGTAEGGIGTNTYATWASATSTGDSGYFAGGGAGNGGNVSSSTGGNGGGGNSNTAGAVNTGGGGGGAIHNTTAGPGGSGLVIIRYAV